MLNDFTWNMTGYIPKHAVNPYGDGIIPYVAERIFQLEPEPPAVSNPNEHILSALQEQNLLCLLYTSVVAHFQPVVFGGLLHADRRLDGFINCHRKISVHNSLESMLLS